MIVGFKSPINLLKAELLEIEVEILREEEEGCEGQEEFKIKNLNHLYQRKDEYERLINIIVSTGKDISVDVELEFSELVELIKN